VLSGDTQATVANPGMPGASLSEQSAFGLRQ